MTLFAIRWIVEALPVTMSNLHQMSKYQPNHLLRWTLRLSDLIFCNATSSLFIAATGCKPLVWLGAGRLPPKPCDALWEQFPCGKTRRFDIWLWFILWSSTERGRSDQSSIIVCSCHKPVIFAPLWNWSWLFVNWS